MIAILKFDGTKELRGWILATDLADATRQAYSAGYPDLANRLYVSFSVANGKNTIQSIEGEFIILASY